MKLGVGDLISRYVRVELDGIDVTKQCDYASEDDGTVRIFAHDPPRVDREMWKMVSGRVEIFLREDAPKPVREKYNEMRYDEMKARGRVI